MPDDQRIAAFQFDARLLRWGESSTAGRTITLELDPDTGASHPFKCYGVGKAHGQRFRILIAPIADDESSALPEAQAEAPARNTNGDRSERAREQYRNKPEWQQAVTRASLLCRDQGFQAWAYANFPECRAADEQGAAEWMRRHLRISSRADIGTDEAAYERFKALETDWKFASRQLPEPR